MHTIKTWLLLPLLLVGCGGDPEQARNNSGDPEPACDICGLGNGKHIMDPDALQPVRKVALRDGGEPRIQHPGSTDTTAAVRVCPRVFGELPRPGMLRVLAPLCEERSADRQVWTWIVVSARPLGDSLAEHLSVTLRCGEQSRIGGRRPRVWMLTLTVDRQLREFGHIAHATLTNHAATGGATGSIGMGADIPADATLAELVVVGRAESIAAVPTRVLLATVDGNPVLLHLVTGEASTEPKPRYPWQDEFAERIYGGRQPFDSIDPEWPGLPDGDRRVDGEAPARSRALGYLAHHRIIDWGEPVRVTRTALNHYRIEFKPTDGGRDRTLIVDPKHGFVDHPRHPR